MGLFLASYAHAETVVAPIIAPLSTKEKVEIAFSDAPVMVKKIKCESGYKQFWPNGKPKISPTQDVGVIQINQTHWKEAKKLGLDIFNSEDDNIKMGRIIYDEQGSSGWNAPATPNCK